MSAEFVRLLRDNLGLAVASLEDMDQHKDNVLYAEALTNRFRLCFECTRHLLNAFLMFQGVKRADFDRQLLEVGMQKGLLSPTTEWQNMLADRNTLVHEYSLPNLVEISRQIEQCYRGLLIDAFKRLNNAVNDI